MIYRFIQPILLPDGSTLQIGDAVILDDDNSKDALALAVKDAVAQGLQDGGEVKIPKAKKERTQNS